MTEFLKKRLVTLCHDDEPLHLPVPGRVARKKRSYNLQRKHPKAKFTPEQIAAIRATWEEWKPNRGKIGYGYLSLAKKYGCSGSTAEDIVKGYSYKDIPVVKENHGN